MFVRALAVLCIGLLLNACAESDGLRSDLGAPPAAKQAQDPRKQTFASKVLAAIAFERVTGRKADPGRLYQLR
jgi:hypothetical protein